MNFIAVSEDQYEDESKRFVIKNKRGIWMCLDLQYKKNGHVVHRCDTLIDAKIFFDNYINE